MIKEIKRARLHHVTLFIIDMLDDVNFDVNYLKISDKYTHTKLFFVSCGEISIYYYNLSASVSYFNETNYMYIDKYIVTQAIKNSQFNKHIIKWIY